ncbi:aminopeptidase [Lachnospiraceae bacterium oral taxon 500]|nr:aminopeptidase [Lachnospiraceae bacterium oral taxon 500]
MNKGAVMEDLKKLKNYAKLAVEIGANLQKGQPAMIISLVETADFARMLAECAYEAGASNVIIYWRDEKLARLKLQYESKETLAEVPAWQKLLEDTYVEKDACFIYVSAEDPCALQGLDMEKVTIYKNAMNQVAEKRREALMNSENTWTIVSVPSQAWAEQVFAPETGKKAMELLWDAIFKVTRMNEADPIQAWRQHIRTLGQKADELNTHNFKYLRYKSSNGTDLTIELPEGHIWLAAAEKSRKGIDFVANMPTEEVFTLPRRDGVNGIVYSSKPLVYLGNVIDEFYIEFKDGAVARYDAKVGREVLKSLIEADEGSNRLGEVALVPYDSPISNSNILFYNTLYDENASCHLALGKAYPTTVKGGDGADEEQLKALGANVSAEHSDFMVGTKDLEIVGETHDGRLIPVFKNGNWA